MIRENDVKCSLCQGQIKFSRAIKNAGNEWMEIRGRGLAPGAAKQGEGKCLSGDTGSTLLGLI